MTLVYSAHEIIDTSDILDSWLDIRIVDHMGKVIENRV